MSSSNLDNTDTPNNENNENNGTNQMNNNENNQNINISLKNVSGKCDLKCSYNFKYTESNLVAKNNDVFISLTYENNGAPPVLYNGQKYTVSGITLVSPSIHTFNNTKVAAELLIEHSPVSGGQTLTVGIPIISSSETSEASNFLTQIIQSVSATAPVKNDSTNLNISGFSLQKIVPIKPFFSYTETEKNADWIVYGMLYAIPLSSTTITTLQQIIKPFPLPTFGGKLFVNTSGPNNETIGEGIYISCKPTGSSQEETAVEYEKNSVSYDFSNILDNSVTKSLVKYSIVILLFFMILYILNYIYSYIIKD
jgi:hypothetical protein